MLLRPSKPGVRFRVRSGRYRRGVADRIAAWRLLPIARRDDRELDRAADAYSSGVRQSRRDARGLVRTPVAARLHVLLRRCARLRTAPVARLVVRSHFAAAQFQRSPIPFAIAELRPARASRRQEFRCAEARSWPTGGALRAWLRGRLAARWF